jgi:hypothetical protein
MFHSSLETRELLSSALRIVDIRRYVHAKCIVRL